MRIIGLDGKEYSSVKACQIADKNYEAKLQAEKERAELEQKRAQEAAEREKTLISKKKKELSDKIEKADEAYVAACRVYDSEKLKAQQLIKDAREEANRMLVAASKEVEKASADKMRAVADFNKEFGVYKTVLTGSRAIEEHNRIVNEINKMFEFFSNIL